MRRLKHLLWIVPVLIVVVVGVLMLNSHKVRTAEDVYHTALPKILDVTSTSFAAGGVIPQAYTCKGSETSPQLAWTGAPVGTKSFAVVVTDSDAPSPSLRLMQIVHWALYDIPADLHLLAEGVNIASFSAAQNFSGSSKFVGPCPPLGRHAYQFRVYALDTDHLALLTNDKAGLLSAMQGHILGYGLLTGYRSRSD